MIKWFKYLLLFISSPFCFAGDINDTSQESSLTYIDVGAGLSTHVVDETDQGAVSGLLKVSVGAQWYSFISTQIGLWYWGNNDNDSDVDRPRERTKFESISASLEVTLQLPLGDKGGFFRSGPYYRYGRHCWSAVLLGLVEPWYKEGCSELHSVGYSFPMSNSRHPYTSFYLEATQSNFDNVSTKSIQLGTKLPF